MRSGKAVGPDELSTDMLKALGRPGIKWMTRILGVVWQEQCIPNEWRTSVLVPIFKKKGNCYTRVFTIQRDKASMSFS